MTEAIDRVLERVAQECVEAVFDARLGGTNDACLAVLERELKPLLEAGQAMAEWNDGNTSFGLTDARKRWDAALASNERPGTL